MMDSTPVERFCMRTEELLQLERESELEQARLLQENTSPKLLEKRGVCLTKLSIDERKTSLYGRQIFKLKSSNVNRTELPANDITTGDIVGLHQLGPNADVTISSGIVVRISSAYVSIAFDQSDELANLGDDCQYYIVKLANDVTYRRLKRALGKLRSGRSLPADRLISILFNQSKESPVELAQTVEFYNKSLDASQREAVQLALSQKHLAIIHGPPGTGKSTTIIEVIQQLVAQGLKVLACAPSNVAVDNLVLRLAKAKVNVTRLGHPARAMHEIQAYSLDAKISATDENCLVEDIRKEIDETLKSMRQGKGRSSSHQSMNNELKALRKELKERSNAAVRFVLKSSDVILSTLSSATDDGPLRILEEMHFDVVVIDECSQALEAACWIALLQAPKCVLAGDHLQLPPTILSQKAAGQGLAITLMERLIITQPSHVHMLTVQYRMNSEIMQWASDELYRSRLTAAPTVANHLLRDIHGVEDNDITGEPLLLIDTDGCHLPELDLPDEQSHGNEGEADLVAIHVSALVDSGVKTSDIAVISPYNLQVELIRNRLSDKYRDLEIKSVDGYQGREKEAVVISLVRSNTKGVVGFLSEDRRLNVAVTRARRQVAVICDSGTVSKHPFIGRLITYMSDHGVVRSAAEYDLDTIGQISDKVAELMTNQQPSNKPKTKSTKSDTKKSANKNRGAKKSSAVQTTNNHSRAEATVSIKETVEEREARIKQEITGIISKFYASDNHLHSFPSTLISYERLIVHQVAEAYGLEHSSTGEGADRHIVVKKSPKTKSEVKLDKHPIEAVNSDVSDVVEDTSETKCQVCSKVIPKSNIHLHRLRCESAAAEKTAAQMDSSCRPKSSNSTNSNKSQSNPSPADEAVKKDKKAKPKKKTIDGGALLDRVDADDFDALLATADKLNSSCYFKKCKTLTKTLGTNCLHCKLRFCMGHAMPEIHGCGQAAKVQARMSISREGKVYPGSGTPNKKPSAANRAKLERKLQLKMDKLSQKRKPSDK